MQHRKSSVLSFVRGGWGKRCFKCRIQSPVGEGAERGAATAGLALTHPTIPAAAVGGGLPATREVQVGLGAVPRVAAAGSRPPQARWGGAPRGLGPRACIPLPAPAPTVELEVADALALSVSGRGTAEAAPQGLTLAARRPPAAGEGHRQQPQGSHPPFPLGTHTPALTACGRLPHVGSRG